jgi:hypothetical protein
VAVPCDKNQNHKINIVTTIPYGILDFDFEAVFRFLFLSKVKI